MRAPGYLLAAPPSIHARGTSMHGNEFAQGDGVRCHVKKAVESFRQGSTHFSLTGMHAPGYLLAAASPGIFCQGGSGMHGSGLCIRAPVGISKLGHVVDLMGATVSGELLRCRPAPRRPAAVEHECQEQVLLHSVHLPSTPWLQQHTTPLTSPPSSSHPHSHSPPVPLEALDDASHHLHGLRAILTPCLGPRGLVYSPLSPRSGRAAHPQAPAVPGPASRRAY
jgi:hypothetical protein